MEDSYHESNPCSDCRETPPRRAADEFPSNSLSRGPWASGSHALPHVPRAPGAPSARSRLASSSTAVLPAVAAAGAIARASFRTASCCSADSALKGAVPVADRCGGNNVVGQLYMEIAPAAARSRPGRTLRRLDRTHPRRMPRRRHRRSSGRAEVRLTVASPPHRVLQAPAANSRRVGGLPLGSVVRLQRGRRPLPAIRRRP